MVLKFPANTAPRKMRHSSTAPPSLEPMANTVNTVTILARPSFTPGIGTRGGIWASTIKTVKAMAVSIANRVIFLSFILPPPFSTTMVTDFPGIVNERVLDFFERPLYNGPKICKEAEEIL